MSLDGKGLMVSQEVASPPMNRSGDSHVRAVEADMESRTWSSALLAGAWGFPGFLNPPPNSSMARIALARPRVDMISSPVATKVGHMVGASFRQPPQPLHCSRLPTNDSSLAAKAS